MYRTLRARLTVWYVGVLGAILVLFSVGFYSLLHRSLWAGLDDNLRHATQVTALALNHETEEHGGKAPGEESVRLVLNTMHQTSFPRPNISVWEGSRLVAEKPGAAGIPARMLPPDAVPSNHSTLTHGGMPYHLSVVDVPVAFSHTEYRVVASESTVPIEQELQVVLRSLLITVPICLLLVAAGGYFLARKSLAPVGAMALAAEQIRSHSLEQRLPVENPRDELGQLAETFNRVFEHLQSAFRQQRRFMADASHELRTPVSVALTATQVSLETRSNDVAALYDTLEVVQSQMIRLRRVVEDMFMLAQADSGAYEATRTVFYLDEIVLETVRAARVLAQARGVSLRIDEMPAGTEYTGDEGLLRQVVMILLDNAVKYTNAGGTVNVNMTLEPDLARITVADTGCGIPPADQPYIFDRFYRADKSRSRRQPGAGSGAGLGLAIARWIVGLHTGRIWLERSDPAGSVFCLELPVPRQSPADFDAASPAAVAMMKEAG